MPTTVTQQGISLVTTALAPDAHAMAYIDRPQHLSTRADDHVVAQRRVSFLVALRVGILRGGYAAQRHAVIQCDIVTDNRRLTDNNAHAVVDEKILSYPGAGMDFNAGHETADLRNPARQNAPTPVPQRMCKRVKDDGVETGITQNDLPTGARGRVPRHHSVDFFPETLEHSPYLPLSMRRPWKLAVPSRRRFA